MHGIINAPVKPKLLLDIHIPKHSLLDRQLAMRAEDPAVQRDWGQKGEATRIRHVKDGTRVYGSEQPAGGTHAGRRRTSERLIKEDYEEERG